MLCKQAYPVRSGICLNTVTQSVWTKNGIVSAWSVEIRYSS